MAAAACAAAGSLDQSFGTGGKVAFLPSGWTGGGGYDIASQSDGTLDDTFDGDANNTTAPSNGNGVVTLAISTNDVINDVLVEPDGKIVAVGYTGAGPVNGLALRLTQTGALDTSFNTTGVSVPAIATDLELFEAVSRDGAGRYWMSGRANMPGPADDDFLAVRLTSPGALDNTFDGDSSNTYGAPGNGVVTTAISTMLPPTANYDRALGNALTPDGKLVAGGWAQVAGASSEQFALVRYLEDGSLDGSFGGDGRVTTPISGAVDQGETPVVQADGKIVLGGGVNIAGDGDFAAIRVSADGSLDPSFGAGGVARTDLGATNDYANGLVLQPDGKMVLGGFGGNAPFALLRYEADPPPASATPLPLPWPVASITSPARKSVKRSRSRSIAGTAGPAGMVAKVEVALRRLDRRLLTRKNRCLWLRDRKRTRFTRRKARRRKTCPSPMFRRAAGRESWSFKLGRSLPKGKYELLVRVTLTDGQAHTVFSAAQGNRLVFRVE